MGMTIKHWIPVFTGMTKKTINDKKEKMDSQSSWE